MFFLRSEFMRLCSYHISWPYTATFGRANRFTSPVKLYSTLHKTAQHRIAGFCTADAPGHRLLHMLKEISWDFIRMSFLAQGFLQQSLWHRLVAAYQKNTQRIDVIAYVRNEPMQNVSHKRANSVYNILNTRVHCIEPICNVISTTSVWYMSPQLRQVDGWR